MKIIKKASIHFFLILLYSTFVHSQTTNTTNSFLDNAQQQRVEALYELQNQINSPFLNDKIHSDEDGSKINFLNLQLDDAFTMIKGIRTAAYLTLETLKRMRIHAYEAYAGEFDDEARMSLEQEKNALIDVIVRSQTTDTINGSKNVAEGTLRIQIGDNSEFSQLAIEIPAFNLSSLSIENLSLLTKSDAKKAVTALDAAIQKMISCVAILDTSALDDAEAMLLSSQATLGLDLILFNTAEYLAIQAKDSSLTDNDREALNIQFQNVKATLNKIQTYVSLDGTKKLGLGGMQIKIGKGNAPENTWHIKLPVTDVKKIGMETLSIQSPESAHDALIAMKKIVRNFAYFGQE